MLASGRVAYLKAGLLALLAALLVGAVTGAWCVLILAVEKLRPEDEAAVLSQSISEAMNAAAFSAALMIPVVLLVAYVVRRRRRRLKSHSS